MRSVGVGRKKAHDGHHTAVGVRERRRLRIADEHDAGDQPGKAEPETDPTRGRPEAGDPRGGERMVYRPAVIGLGRVHFSKSTYDVDLWETIALMPVISGDVPDDIWADTESINYAELAAHPVFRRLLAKDQDLLAFHECLRKNLEMEPITGQRPGFYFDTD